MSAAGEYKPYFSSVYSYNSNGIALCSGACPSRPVINLNANVLATGTGTSSDPYLIQIN